MSTCTHYQQFIGINLPGLQCGGVGDKGWIDPSNIGTSGQLLQYRQQQAQFAQVQAQQAAAQQPLGSVVP